MRNGNRSWWLPAAAASSALLLAGCQAHNPAALPAPLRVELPDTCEQILTEVVRRPFGPDDDAIGAYLQRDGELDIANDRIRTGNGCNRDQRHDYAGQGGH